MTRDQVISEAKAEGYSHILTLAGPIPLETWTPYGYAGHSNVSFLIQGNKIHERPIEGVKGFTIFQDAMILGLWTLLTEGTL